MIVMLIVTLVLAATTPLITKRHKNQYDKSASSCVGILIGNLCIDKNDSGDNTWAAAKQACESNGKRLPLFEELDTLYANRGAIGGFSAVPYWSATEEDTNNSWARDFSAENSYAAKPKSNIYKARCVKSRSTPVAMPPPTAPTSSTRCNDNEISIGLLCIAKTDTISSPINTCSDTTWDSNGATNVYCATNYWAAAKKACSEQGMRLPFGYEIAIFTSVSTFDTLNINLRIGQYYWSTTEVGSSNGLAQIANSNGTIDAPAKNGNASVRCVRTP